MTAKNLSTLKKFLTPYALAYTRPLIQASCYSILDRLTPSYQCLNPSKTLPFILLAAQFSSQSLNSQPSSRLPLSRDGNYDESNAQAFPVCPGCGIHMQDFNSSQPGFYVEPSIKGPGYKKFKKMVAISDESEISESLKKGFMNEIVDVDSLDALATDDSVFNKMPMNGGTIGSSDGHNTSGRPVVCSRCHSLRHYQKVHEPSAENLLPDFDFDHTVGRRLKSISGSRSVILMVVDATDFDGSFPKKVANLVSKTIDENAHSWKEGKSGNVPRLVLVVTKIDLLPSNISPTGFEHWVRTRARENGAGRLTSLHLVSAVKDWGVKTLVDDVIKYVGQRGNVWAVGAQNAGKSTLINAIAKCVGVNATHLTEAPVPGTTLGIVRVEGLLPGKAKLFDTPGLLHPHQISTRLSTEEQKLLRIPKELKPRTYRIKVGHSVHVGGLLRFDIEESSVDSIYVTVWASPLIPLHMGKTENACKLMEEHFGHQLQPPIGKERVEKLGKWVKKEFDVSGNWWDSSSVDIAAAGLGWLSIGLKGKARVSVWTYEGVDVIARNALLPQRSHQFEAAGFTVSEIVSKADRSRNKKNQNEKRKHRDSTTASSLTLSTLDADSNSTSSTPEPALTCYMSSPADVHAASSDSVSGISTN